MKLKICVVMQIAIILTCWLLVFLMGLFQFKGLFFPVICIFLEMLVIYLFFLLSVYYVFLKNKKGFVFIAVISVLLFFYNDSIGVVTWRLGWRIWEENVGVDEIYQISIDALKVGRKMSALREESEWRGGGYRKYGFSSVFYKEQSDGSELLFLNLGGSFVSYGYCLRCESVEDHYKMKLFRYFEDRERLLLMEEEEEKVSGMLR